MRSANPEDMFYFSENVDCDRRSEVGPLSAPFRDLQWDSRFAIKTAFYQEIYNNNKKTKFFNQELNDVACAQLTKFYEGLGLKVESTKYTTHSGAFNYLFAYNPEYYEVEKRSQVYYTKTGKPTSQEERDSLSKEENIQNHFGTEFEKSAQLIWVRNKITGTTTLDVNMHPGLEIGLDRKTGLIVDEMNHRILAMKRLCEQLQNEHGNVILIGDFNQFDPRFLEPTIYADQIKVLQSYGFRWASEGLCRVGMKATFVSKPYDFEHLLAAEKLAEFRALKQNITDQNELRLAIVKFIQDNNVCVIGTCLDGVFTRGLPETASITVKSCTLFHRKIVYTDEIENGKAFQDQYLQHFVDNRADAGVEPVIGSDHMAMSMTVKF